MGGGNADEDPGHEAVIEVEVERLPEGASDRPPDPGHGRSEPAEKLLELGDAVGPILGGLLVDVLDAATVTPVLGLILGWPLGYYILRQMGLRPGAAGRLGALVAVYCAIPGTLGLPIATLVGVGVKVRQVFRRR